MNIASTDLLQLDSSSAVPSLRIAGAWTLHNYARLEQQLASLALPIAPSQAIDLQQLEALDTAGAALLVKLLGNSRSRQLSEQLDVLPAARRALLATVSAAL